MASLASRPLVRRALLLCGGLFLLWLVVQSTALVVPAEASDEAFPGADASQRGAPGEAVQAPASPSGIRVFSWGNVAAVLLLVGGGGYALYLRRGGSPTQGPSTFTPMGQFSLGSSQQLQLVACGGEVLLLGVTEQEVNLIKAYPREAFDGHPVLVEEAGKGAAEAGPSAPASPLPAGFSKVLRSLVQQNASA